MWRKTKVRSITFKRSVSETGGNVKEKDKFDLGNNTEIGKPEYIPLVLRLKCAVLYYGKRASR